MQEYTSLTAATLLLVSITIIYYVIVFVADLLVVCAPDVAYKVREISKMVRADACLNCTHRPCYGADLRNDKLCDTAPGAADQATR